MTESRQRVRWLLATLTAAVVTVALWILAGAHLIDLAAIATGWVGGVLVDELFRGWSRGEG